MPRSVDPRSFLPLTPHAFQVLLALADGDRHGYGIIVEVEERTDGMIRLRTGTLYTLLQRLLEEGLIEQTVHAQTAGARERRGASGSPQASVPGGVQGAPPIKEEDDPRRKYYRLTALGRDVLTAEARRLESVLGDARRKRVIGRA